MKHVRLNLLRSKAKTVDRQRRALIKALQEEGGADLAECSPDELLSQLSKKDPLKKVLQEDSSLAYWFQKWYQKVQKSEPHLKELVAADLREVSHAMEIRFIAFLLVHLQVWQDRKFVEKNIHLFCPKKAFAAKIGPDLSLAANCSLATTLLNIKSVMRL